MYTFESRIRYSECDSEERLSIQSLIDYFQDCTTFHSESLGVGTSYLRKVHRAWVLNNWQIIFEKAPKMGELVTIGTFPYDMKGFLGYRNFVLDGADGTRYAYAHTLWSYLDTDTMRPTKVPEEMIALYKSEPKLEMEVAPRKIVMPEGMEQGEEILVTPLHLDTNHHVNNGQYIRMALNYMPEQMRVRELRAEYKKAAVLGNRIIPKVLLKENVLYVALQDEMGEAYVNIQLFLEEV